VLFALSCAHASPQQFAAHAAKIANDQIELRHGVRPFAPESSSITILEDRWIWLDYGGN
jgi:hypothetical protein